MAKVKINRDFCKSCGLCINFCPQKILVLNDKLNKRGVRPAKVTDENKCLGCMNSILVCTEACIELYK